MATATEKLETPATLHSLLREHNDELLNCVHCGLCLPSCPTYRALGNENDSPRGRVYLMRGLVENKIALGETFTHHIDLCLGCRACETACPSGVPYGRLLEAARAEIVESATEQRKPMALFVRLVLNQVFTRPRLLGLSMKFAKWFRDSGLAELAFDADCLSERLRFALAVLLSSRSPFMSRGQAESDNAVDSSRTAKRLARDADSAASSLLSSSSSSLSVSLSSSSSASLSSSSLPSSSPSSSLDKSAASQVSANDSSKAQTRVGVLRGCVMEGLFSQANRATERVLRRNACEIAEVKEQSCCGALHAHAGHFETAKKLARQNIKAFLAQECEQIIVNSAGCGAAMKEYKDWLTDDKEFAAKAKEFSAKVKDVAEFLAERGIAIPERRVDLLVTYDAPCHLLHAQRLANPPIDLLKAIPGLKLRTLAGAENCCGGAGIYNLQHPDLSAEILSGKLENIKNTGADMVVTANPGCIMQIGAGAKMSGLTVKVVHPIELLDAAYEK
jgi:glycolate oxidase iron-sulfur subunit